MFFENANNITIDGQEVQSIRIGGEEVYKKSKNIYENPLITSTLDNIDVPINAVHFIMEFDIKVAGANTTAIYLGKNTSSRTIVFVDGLKNGVSKGSMSSKLITGQDFPTIRTTYHIIFEYNNGEISYNNSINNYSTTYQQSDIMLSMILCAGSVSTDTISNLVVYEVKD